jgi:class 3 adenylate cyclase/tetratricopeptide (TPR) repeat protein
MPKPPQGFAPDEPIDSACEVPEAADRQRSEDDLARLPISDSTPEDRATAARCCADLPSLVAAWQTETHPTVRLALASALADALCEAGDGRAVAALLEADHCTDAIRFEVAHRTQNPELRRIAIATIRDEDLLARVVHLDNGQADHGRAVTYLEPPPTGALISQGPPRQPMLPASDGGLERTSLYVPRILQQHLADDPDGRWWTEEGTSAFIDISGFTTLSEQLARKGREGAEQIAEVVGSSFESILEVAYDNGGSLLKFGGDSLLLWFAAQDHAARASRATVLMRRVLRDVGRIDTLGAKVTLRITQGVHSGRFHFFAVGDSHVELLPVGPAWSRLVSMESSAAAGQIVISPETGSLLPGRCLGDAQGAGRLLLREPPNHVAKVPHAPRPRLSSETLGRALSSAIRAHVLGGGGTSEHRAVTVAFIRFEGTDALIEQRGPQAAAEALHRLISAVQAATEQQAVTFLASDVDADGGKLILTAGAPKVTGDDEERMLLALQSIVAADLPLAIRIGVHRGSVFAGDIGPAYRRTYTVMGDAVNLTARLMAKAEPGQIYATADVLDHSNTLFLTRELEPFVVKGKAQPIRAWSVGRAAGSRSRHSTLEDHPLVGRETELGIVREALADVRAGSGRLIEIVGEAGIGKTRLLETLRHDAADLRQLHAVCEAYTAHTPYSLWRELLREFMGFGRDDPDDVVAERLRDWVSANAPELTPWLPLIAIAFDAEIAPTPEVQMLAERNRRTKLHEVVGRFLEILIPEPALIEIENAHHMDAASAELLSSLVGRLGERPWLVGVTRRPTDEGFAAPESVADTRMILEPLALKDALYITQLASEQHPLPMHVLETVAKRSGGNPQFLRDLLRAAIESGGVGGLPDSAEAAAMARIDALTPQDRALVRRAAVFGLTFHPRNVAWLAEEGEATVPGPATWERLQELFDEEGDGYLRFRRSLLRDTAYEGLPYKLRRRLHRIVAARLEQELDDPEEYAAILSLHYFVAGEYRSAWRYAGIGAKHAEDVYAYLEAAGLYARAIESGERLGDLGTTALATMYESLGDSWNRAGEFKKASDAHGTARKLIEGDPLWKSRLLLKRSKMEEKLGKCAESLRWAARARKVLEHVDGREGAKQAAHVTAWYATVLQNQGRTNDAVRWAQRAVDEAEAIDDPDALGAAYFVIGWAYSELGKDGVEPLWQRSLEAYRRAGNRERQAGLLSNLGGALQWEGRWDEALTYYERGREESQKIGDLVDAEIARLNVTEILTYRGELVEAEKILLESLPRWRALQYRYFLGACLSMLGRVAICASRFTEALVRLEEARAHFAHVGAEQEVLDVDARIAECRVLMRETDAALELASATLARARMSKGVPRVAALLERVRGRALLQGGDPVGARAAFEASLAAARNRRDSLEITLTSLSLIELHRSQGVEPPPEIVAETDALLSSLKIQAGPGTPASVV